MRSTLGVLSISQDLCFVVLFCDTVGDTGTGEVLGRGEAAMAREKERITKGVGQIRPGAQRL